MLRMFGARFMSEFAEFAELAVDAVFIKSELLKLSIDAVFDKLSINAVFDKLSINAVFLKPEHSGGAIEV